MQTRTSANRNIHHLDVTRKQELESLLAVLFRPTELVEIRAITSAREHKPGRVIRRLWCTPTDLIGRYEELCRLNKRANLYFGVNPRRDTTGTKSAISFARCIWADLDHVTEEDAAVRWRPRLPKPSIVINSGSGIHLYWLLTEDHHVDTPQKRTLFEAGLKRLYQDLGADAVQDVSRMLRLPGFFNLKCGKIPCSLLAYSPQRQYLLETFAKWMNVVEPTEARSADCNSFPTSRNWRRIRGVLKYLDRDVEDRSRRDYAVIARAIELGLSRDELWQLVREKSKFATHGEPYFQTTFDNALKRVGAHARSPRS